MGKSLKEPTHKVVLMSWSAPHKGFVEFSFLLAFNLFHQSHHSTFAMWHCKETSLRAFTKIIFMITEVDEKFPVFILYDKTIRKIVNKS
jgi:hypothetical protein